MIEIPPEVQVKSTIKPGTVYYFTEESFKSEEPHYFIVINHDPVNDEVVLMVCASSKVEKVIRRRKKIQETIIIIEESGQNIQQMRPLLHFSLSRIGRKARQLPVLYLRALPPSMMSPALGMSFQPFCFLGIGG